MTDQFEYRDQPPVVLHVDEAYVRDYCSKKYALAWFSSTLPFDDISIHQIVSEARDIATTVEVVGEQPYLVLRALNDAYGSYAVFFDWTGHTIRRIHVEKSQHHRYFRGRLAEEHVYARDPPLVPGHATRMIADVSCDAPVVVPGCNAVIVTGSIAIDRELSNGALDEERINVTLASPPTSLCNGNALALVEAIPEGLAILEVSPLSPAIDRKWTEAGPQVIRPDERIGVIDLLYPLAKAAFDGRSIANLPVSAQIAPSNLSPYCGLDCIYVGSQLLQRPVAYDSLLRAEYVGTSQGSSFQELARAAEDSGIQYQLHGRLRATDLLAIGSPAILHMRADVQCAEFTHFALYLGNGANGMYIFDPPSMIRAVAPAELDWTWDGTAMILGSARSDVKVSSVAVAQYIRIGLLLVLAAMCAIALQRLRSSGISFSIAFGISVALGFLTDHMYCGTYKMVGEEASFLSSLNDRARIPTLTASAARDQSDIVFLDARTPAKFADNHIAGAMSVSLTNGHAGIAQLLTSIPRRKCVLVYDDKSGMGDARALADLLLRSDVRGVYVLDDDWRNWSP